MVIQRIWSERILQNKDKFGFDKTQIEILKGLQSGNGFLQKGKMTAKASALVIEGSRHILNLQRFYT